jgi:hypothetical protein
MRESPSCVVTVRRFGVRRMAVAVVALAAIAALAMWATAAWQPQPTASAFALAAGAGLAGLGSLLLALSLSNVPSGVLACANGQWAFTPDRSADQGPEPAALAVAIDLGSFLLLTLTAEAAGRQSRRWLPVQRRGLDDDWHALRCAVYSPPPVTPDAAADESLP